MKDPRPERSLVRVVECRGERGGGEMCRGEMKKELSCHAEECGF